MPEIGIIADDFTGANDVGLQFIKYGFSVISVLDISVLNKQELKKADVIVIDTESRFLTPDLAYKKVKQAVRCLKELHVKRFYKKVDSTLRGNISYELKALSDELNCAFLPFVAAFPDAKRTTINGYVYVNGKILHETSFNYDTGNPVLSSYLPAILEKGELYKVSSVFLSDIRNKHVFKNEIKDKIIKGAKVIAFDAKTNKDMSLIAEAFKNANVAAGAAGFSGFLAKFWLKNKTLRPIETYEFDQGNIFGVFGSINEVTRSQINEIKKRKKANVIEINPAAYLFKKNSSFLRNNLMKKIINKLDDNDTIIYTAPTLKSVKETMKICKAKQVKSGKYISEFISDIVQKILKKTSLNRIVLSGGDTAFEVCNDLGIKAVRIKNKILTGVALVEDLEKKYSIVTKPGGFGPHNALMDIFKNLKLR